MKNLTKFMEPRINIICKVARKLKGSVRRMLDLGCSDGSLTLAIKEACGAEEVYGIDIDANALKIAQQRGIKVFCINLDQGQLPFKDQTFCLVSICGLLEFLDNPDNVIAESHRVLRKGGFLLLHARNLANWANRLSLLLGFQPYGVRASSKIGGLGLLFREEPLSSVKNHCAFTLKALVELLRYYDFNVVDIKGACGVNPQKFPIKLVDRLVSWTPSLARNVIVLAVKK